MSADIHLLPITGRVADAPSIGTVLVTELADGRWQITLRGYGWGLRLAAPHYGADRHRPATPRWLQDGQAAAEGIAEAHGLGIDWHERAHHDLATGVFFRA